MEEVARQLVLLHVPWVDMDQFLENGVGWIDLMNGNNLNVEDLPYFKALKCDLSESTCDGEVNPADRV